MIEFKTESPNKRLLIVFAVVLVAFIVFSRGETFSYYTFGTPLLIFLAVFLSISEVRVNEEEFVFLYPNLIFHKSKHVLWNEIERIKVHFTEGLIDAGKPSSITIILKSGKEIKRNYNFSKENYYKLEELSKRLDVPLERKGIVK